MRNPLLSFVLLLILGFGQISGHLVCQPAEASQGAPVETEESPMPCHAHASKAPADAPALRSGAPASDHDCCSDEHGVCQHACHMIADMGDVAPLLIMQGAERMPRPRVDRSLSLHPQPIDHIPLS